MSDIFRRIARSIEFSEPGGFSEDLAHRMVAEQCAAMDKVGWFDEGESCYRSRNME